jgi:hypothetical protein
VASGPKQPGGAGWYFALAQVGLEMFVPIAVGAWLDASWGWSPWATATGAVVGFVGGLAHILQLLKKYGEDGGSRQGRS